MTLPLEELTGQIIGAAIDVHRTLGPGFVEAIYENALALELQARNIPFERQLPVPIHYRGVEIGQHRLDLFVANSVVVELKAIKVLDDVHFAMARSYLRAIGRRHGLLLNFSKVVLDVKRIVVKAAEF